jgi:hypothetical protein
MPLETYHEKRDFRQTPEPETAGKPAKGKLRFVVQRHDDYDPEEHLGKTVGKSKKK